MERAHARAETRHGARGPVNQRTGWLKRVATRWPALRYSVAFPIRARGLGARLPPGSIAPVQARSDTDQHFFLERSRELGPVFKLVLHGNYTTCVLGHERGARLIGEHEDHLPGVTIDLEPLFPIGALRGMSGDTHRTYRRKFLHAIQATPLSAHREALDREIRTRLRAMADTNTPVAGDELRDRLRRLTTAIMLRLLFGLTPESPAYAVLEESYRRFGPGAPATNLGEEQVDAFASIQHEISTLVRGMAKGAGREGPPCLLRQLVQSAELDPTAMGNLAYLFEPSHFDLYSLWVWTLKYLGAEQRVLESYRARQGEERRAYAEAIVLETLRMEQSELLYRRVTADIVFEGYLLPRDTLLRVLIWEGHKDASVFTDPFTFEPDRFLARKPGLDTYAPFGLGQRHCLGAPLVLGLSTMFVQALLDDYDVCAIADGPPRKNPYHWQPGPELAIRLTPRSH